MKNISVAVLSAIVGGIIGAVTTGKMSGNTIKEKVKKVDKYKSYYDVLNQWLILKQENKSLEKYFIDNNYKTIAIYGMGEMGNRLYEELKDSSINVKYAIDKESGSVYSELDVLDLEDALEQVDVIVVTAIFAYDKIEKDIAKVVDYKVVSLEDVVYEI